MRAEQRPDPAASGGRSTELTRRTGAAVGALLIGALLVVLNLVTAYFVAIAWIVTPDGAYDRDVLEGIAAAVFVGTGLALLTALLTLIPVMTRWLGKRWLIVPAVLFLLAMARWVHIDVVYPDDLPGKASSVRTTSASSSLL